MKGYELLKEIAEGKIKEGTMFQTQDCKKFIYKYSNIYILESWVIPDCNWFYNNEREFEIIQDEPEEIEEIDYKQLEKEILLTQKDYLYIDKINELTIKVNEINRKLEEK